MSEPTFFPEQNQPKSSDNIWRLTAKIAGSLYSLVSAGIPAPSGSATSANQTNKSQFTQITDGTDTLLVNADGSINVVSSGGGGGGGAVTVADGADVAEGAVADAAVASGATGTISGKLRGISARQTDGTQQTKLTDGTNVVAVVTGSSDATNATTNRLAVRSHPSTWNGATWDLMRSGFTAITSTLTGYANSLPFIQYLSTPPVLTNGQSIVNQCDVNGRQLSNAIVGDGTNTVSVSTSTADAAVSALNRLRVSAFGFGYNGSTWDMLRSGITAATTAVTGFLNHIPLLQFNSTLPAPSTGQVVAQQCDANGKTLMGTRTAPIVVALAGSTSPAYSVLDCIGGLITVAAATDAVGSGVLQSIVVNCKSVQTNTLKVALFKANPSATTFTDNAAIAINVADFNKLCGILTMGAGDSSLTTHTNYNLDGIGKAFGLTSGTTFYAALINSAGTPTLTATTDYEITFNFMKD